MNIYFVLLNIVRYCVLHDSIDENSGLNVDRLDSEGLSEGLVLPAVN